MSKCWAEHPCHVLQRSVQAAHPAEYDAMVVPGVTISGLKRPSRVGPTDEKKARLSHLLVGRVRVLKVTVSPAPARMSCSKSLAVLADMKAEGMVMAGPDQPLSGCIFSKPSSWLLYTRAATAPPFCALATCSAWVFFKGGLDGAFGETKGSNPNQAL